MRWQLLIQLFPMFLPLAISAQELRLRPAIVYPLMESSLSSDFGLRQHPISGDSKYHAGLDIPASYGTPIRATGQGLVIFAGRHGGYGNLVVVKHGDTLTTHYGHCRKIFVSLGDEVRAGQIVATVGDSGAATGPHLHFELRRSGQPLNPKLLLPGYR